MKQLGAAILHLLFPQTCLLCSSPVFHLRRYPVCEACLQAVSPLSAEYFCRKCLTPFYTPYPLDETGQCLLCRTGVIQYDAAYSYGYYEGTLRELIHLFKYGRIRGLGEPLGQFLAKALPRNIDCDALVPVPLHWSKRLERGFNQAEVLACEVGRRTGLPVVKLLKRTRRGRAQAGLSRRQRRENVRRLFIVKNSRRVKGGKFLIVDDVLTTGSTASSCARVLKEAGAAYVGVLTVARVEPRTLVGFVDSETLRV